MNNTNIITVGQFEGLVDKFGKEFSREFYELQVSNLLKFITSSSTTVSVPDDFDKEAIDKVGKETGETIGSLTKDIVKEAVKDENPLSLTNISKLANPSNFTETVCKTIQEHVDSEWATRAEILNHKFQKALQNGNQSTALLSEEVYKSVEAYAKQKKFVNRDVADNLKMMLEHQFGTEGLEIIESIKDEIITDIEHTEAKNAIIRDAIEEISEKKKEIEEEINEDINPDESLPEPTTGTSEETSSESLKVSLEAFPITNFIETYREVKTVETEVDFSKSLGLEMLSQEELDDIKRDFSKYEGDLSKDKLSAGELGLSDSSAEEVEEDADNDDDKEAEHSEEVYGDDDEDQSKYEVNEDVFNYNDENEIRAEALSEESYAKAILPLSVSKFAEQKTNVDYKRLAVLLACTKDRGAEFFNNTDIRIRELTNMIASMENTSEVEDSGIVNKLDVTSKDIAECRNNVKTIVDKMGILGLLEGQFQLDEDHMKNGIKKVVFPELSDKKVTSTENFEEDIAEAETPKGDKYTKLFSLALEANKIKDALINNLNVSRNKERLGDVEELINEKLLNFEGNERFDAETKINALVSLESFVPISEIADFIKKLNPTKSAPKRELENFKDIALHGYSYDDVVDGIISSVKSKHEVPAKTYNIDVNKVVSCVCEAIDTTRIDETMYEKILVKLISENDGNVTNSMEGIVIKNKGRAILSSIFAADKLRLLTSSNKESILSYLG